MGLLSKKPRVRSPKRDNSGRTPLTAYYRSGQTDSRSPFQKKPAPKKRFKFVFGFLDIVLIAVLLFGLAYSMGVTSHPKVIVDDSSFHQASVYSAAAAGQFQQFKNRNKITFNDQAVSSALQKQFPEINNVQIELPFFSEQATIRIAIAEPSFQLHSHNTDYIVGTNGIIIAKASDLPNIKNLATVDDQSGFTAAVGEPVLSADSVGFINTVIAECKHYKVPIASLILPTTPEELDLRTTDQSYYVKFYLGGDALDEAGQFLAARSHFNQTKQPPSQYLDVRVQGKVFYK